jgi:hypothetical protein
MAQGYVDAFLKDYHNKHYSVFSTSALISAGAEPMGTNDSVGSLGIK